MNLQEAELYYWKKRMEPKDDDLVISFDDSLELFKVCLEVIEI